MVMRTRFIALEGIDGAGKRTQLDLLVRLLQERKIAYTCFSFPRYDSFFGRQVARYLNGGFGPLEAVDPHFSALLYAGDRWEAREKLAQALHPTRVVLADRYIASNLAHQGARVPAERREAFFAWVKQLEYEVFGLPREDLVIYLRLPAGEAQRLVARKAAREYTSRSQDLHEADLRHLEEAARVYDQLAGEENWVTVECLDAQGNLRTPDEIHTALVKAVEGRKPDLLVR